MISVNIDMTLVMWEKVDMPVSIKDEATGKWVKTKETEERTRYYLRDEFGEKLEFLAGNEYRDMEGTSVQLTLGIQYNDWKNANEVKLVGLEQLA